MNRFNIGRVHGTPKWVDLPTNVGNVRIGRRSEWAIFLTVEELQQIVPGFQLMSSEEVVKIPVQDYDNHFLFEGPEEILGPSYMCSCGSPANFYGSEAYEHGATAIGLELHCQHVIDHGKHADIE